MKKENNRNSDDRDLKDMSPIWGNATTFDIPTDTPINNIPMSKDKRFGNAMNPTPQNYKGKTNSQNGI